MTKVNKWLVVSTLFFAILSLVLAAATVHYSQKSDDLAQNRQLSPENKGTVPIEAPGGTVPDGVSAGGQGAGAGGTVPAAARGIVPTQYYEMEVRNFDILDDGFWLALSHKPDLNVVKEYISVDPAPKGGLSFALGGWRDYDFDARRYLPTLHVKGDFAYRTNLTLTVRKGLPIAGVNASSNVVVRALEADYVHTFRRPDRSPKVSFSDKGRYLPPVGKRALRVESTNVDKIKVAVSRVPAANVVQMLALEEDAYNDIRKSYWSSDDGFVKDISFVTSQSEIEMPNVLNTLENTTVSLATTNNVASNGVFLVCLDGVSKKDEFLCTEVARVVCVSDLAISMRKTKAKMYAWVTSFTKGVPVEGVEVTVYSKANVPVAKGRTDANGLCECVKIADGKPFAAVAVSADGKDMSFIAFANSSTVAETFSPGTRPAYLGEKDVTAFAWTERGIYRHGEQIFFHALLRNADFKAPPAMPVEIMVKKPGGDVYLKKTVVSDSNGAVFFEEVKIPHSQPSGVWKFVVKIPGDIGETLFVRNVKIEEFAPPQIRVKTAIDKTLKPQDLSFEISAEHLYGAPASGLMSDGAVVFEDAAFAPAAWKNWRFGDKRRALKPNYRRLAKTVLDASGKAKIFAPLFKDTGLPAASVRATVQGCVIEDGGRPATSCDKAVLHYYPYYIGTTLGEWIKLPGDGIIKMSVACVAPDGKALGEAKELKGTLVRIDNVYSYETRGSVSSWKCERVRTTVAEDLTISVGAGKEAQFELPALACGDYEFEISDPESEVMYCSSFYASEWGDENVRAFLGNPSSVTLTADKPFYRPGDKPRIRVRSPFTGKALLGVFRDDVIYTEVISLTNATTEIELRELDATAAPNIDVSLSVIHAVSAETRHMAARAHGETTLSVRRPENEIDVRLEALHKGCSLNVDVEAPGAATVVVTVVDEGINILTDEKTPDPVAVFAALRAGDKTLFDLYNRLLPVVDGNLGAAGLKTGGGAGADLLDRVSPVATRRFKPLSLWRKNVSLKDGKASVSFTLPEFAGEVRVTAVAYSAAAAGAKSVQTKVAPKLVVQPDAPRFAAPGDEYTITLPMTNRSGADGDVAYKINAYFDGGDKAEPIHSGAVFVKKDCTKILPFKVKAPSTPGHVKIVFETSGLGETHCHEIELPIRPAVAWRETAGVAAIEPGGSFKLPKSPDAMSRFRYSVSESPASELKDALEWLADYPYGCLEQTVSRVFPLIAAGGILNSFSSIEAVNRAEYVESGVRRVKSMMNYSGFITWPDCWNDNACKEYTLYAAHFLVEAEKALASSRGIANRDSLIRILRNLARDADSSSASYACHTLALAGVPDKGRMYSLYDNHYELDLLSRARLARAFGMIGDRDRALALLDLNAAPSSVKEAAFTLIALLELNPDDKRVNELVTYLASKRGKERYSWGTTTDNAHAVLALAEYFRRRPVTTGLSDVREGADGTVKNVGSGTAFLSWKRLDLPKFEDVKAESNGLRIKRGYFTAAGEPYDISKASRGDFIVVRITVSADDNRIVEDLIIEDLLPGALEGVRSPIAPAVYGWMDKDSHDWVLRHEMRDDRVLVFSKQFQMKKDEEIHFHYPVRVVSSGTYQVPGVAVEAMYHPELRARGDSCRIVFHD